MRFVVTGGAGFIGSHLVDALIAGGHAVTVIDDLSTGRRDNLSSAARLIEASISDADCLQNAVAGAAGVFHLAARVSVQDCIENWLAGHADNLVGTINVFAAARAAGCPVVYASSAAVYGDCSGRICDETMKEAPISPYGADKLACEHQARAFAAIHGLPSMGLRFFNVYGPRQDPSSPYAGVISRFIDNACQGRAHLVFGDGLQSRDFIEVADVVAGLLAGMDHLRGQVAANRAGCADIVNLCTGRATSLLDLIAAIDGVAGGQGKTGINHAAPRAGDIRHSIGATGQMQSALNLVAQVPLEQGLARLIAHDPGPVLIRARAGAG